jgi:hypothetical protein
MVCIASVLRLRSLVSSRVAIGACHAGSAVVSRRTFILERASGGGSWPRRETRVGIRASLQRMEYQTGLRHDAAPDELPHGALGTRRAASAPEALGMPDWTPRGRDGRSAEVPGRA